MTAAVVEFCLCGHEESAHGLRCYYESECGCREFVRDSGRDNG